MRKLYIFVLTLFSLVIISSGFIKSANAGDLLGIDFLNNNSGTNWEVIWRLGYIRLSDSARREPGANMYSWSNSGPYWFGNERPDDWRRYYIHWSTSCVDPEFPFTGENCVPVGAGADLVCRFNLLTQNVSYKVGGDGNNLGQVRYNGNTGATFDGTTCPADCPVPSCTGRCGIVTNSCGNTANCGGCPADACGTGDNWCNLMGSSCGTNKYCSWSVKTRNARADCNGVGERCWGDGVCGANQYCDIPGSTCGTCTTWAKIGGRVYVDANGNGSWQDWERTFPGIPVTINNPAGSDTTGPNGGYNFPKLKNPSRHDISIDRSSIDSCRFELMNSNPRNDVTATPTKDDVDFRFQKRNFVVRGTVYKDVNRDGVLDTSRDTPMTNTNVMIRLKNAANTNILASTHITNTGTYRFEDVEKDSYNVKLDPDFLPPDFSVVSANPVFISFDCSNIVVNFLVSKARPAQADLEVVYFNFPDGAPNQWLDSMATILNSGGATTVSSRADNQFRVRFKKNDGTGVYWDVLTGPLSPGEYRDIWRGVQLPAGAGVYTGEVIVDPTGPLNPNGLVDEFAEGNNNAFDTYYVGVPPPVDIPPPPPPDPVFSISGTVYEDLNNNGALDNGESPRNDGGTVHVDGVLQGLPGGSYSVGGLAGGWHWASFAINPTLAAAGYQVSYPSGNLYALLLGDGCQNWGYYQILCSGGSVTGANFGIYKPPPPPWFQGVGGDMRADKYIPNYIPNGPNFWLSINEPTRRHGLVFGRGDYSFVGGAPSKANQSSWYVNDTPFSQPIIKTSYNYLITKVTRKSSATMQEGCALPECFDIPTTPGFYIFDGNLTINQPLTINNGNYVFFVAGNLTINQDIKVSPGSTLFFIVQESISVDKNVRNIQGIYSADKDFTVKGDRDPDPELLIEGSVVVNAIRGGYTFINKRDLADNNSSLPSVKIKYRPDFILNAPELIRTNSYRFNEVLPGTDR